MTSDDLTLEKFIDTCKNKISDCQSASDCVNAIVPAMYELLRSDMSFLKPEHLKSDPEHYARNAIYIEEDALSLYALVWLPGQKTPVHDHGTWGVVGIVDGTLDEKSLIRVDREKREATKNIELASGGVTMLTPGTITSFVPNPDHIHVTGNGHSEKAVVSLHLYGRAMSSFHIYDIESGTRELIEVSHS